MSEPYELIECAESPTGNALVVRGKVIAIGDRDGFDDPTWLAKLQSKADYFASLMDNS